MAKRNIKLSIKGELDLEEGTITEFTKDSENAYKLKDLLTPFDGLDNINITISYDSEVQPE